MKTLTTLLVALGAVGFALADTVLYDPAKSIADQHISVHPWASGTIAETDDPGFGGANSIRFSTKNMFCGGKIVFNGNPDLSKDYGDKSILLELTFRIADDSTVMGGGPGGIGPGGRGPGGKGPGTLGPGGAGAGKGPGSIGPGGPGGIGGPGGAFNPGGRGGVGAGAGGGKGAAGGPSGGPPQGPGSGGAFGAGGRGGLQGPGGLGGSATAEKKKLNQLRLIITTTDGLKSEVYLPADAPKDANGWRQVGVPLQVITGLDRTNKIIKDVSISGDVTTTIWIGYLQTISDQTPIRGDANVQDLNLAEGDEVTLSANGYGGASLLKYSWYFGDATNGLPDAEGQAIKHKFDKPEESKITLVISDYFGLKQPYKTTINVKVN